MTLRCLTLVLAVATLALPTVAFAAEGFTRSTTTLRAGPGSDYPRVARVSGGRALEIYGCLARGSWCDVTAEGERGWLPGSRIDFLGSGRRTHLSSHFSGLGLAILSFGQDDYWGNHYAGRPWVNDRRWQRGRQSPTSPNRPAVDPTPRHPGVIAPTPPGARVDTPPPPHAGPTRTGPGAARPPSAGAHPVPAIEPPRTTAPHVAPALHPAPMAPAAPAVKAPPAPHPAAPPRPAGAPPVPPIPGASE